METLKAAFAFANDRKRNGDGYMLRVILRSGKEIFGDVYAWPGGNAPLHMAVGLVGDDQREQAFIDPREIAVAIVVWP